MDDPNIHAWDGNKVNHMSNLRDEIVKIIERNVGEKPCHTNFCVAADEILMNGFIKIPRCPEKNAEVGQCELRFGHPAEHLAGYLMWSTKLPLICAACEDGDHHMCWDKTRCECISCSDCEGCKQGWLLDEIVKRNVHRKPVEGGFVPFFCTRGKRKDWIAVSPWISVKERKPPEANLVFITDGKDMGIGSQLEAGWKIWSGHAMVPTHWHTIEFPDLR